ncbi:unnamed protein product, partial [Ectocarpus sp. 8 AP-2014]
GASGSVLISTGTASLGDSGSITLATGPAAEGGKSGNVRSTTPFDGGPSGDGGALMLLSGNSTGDGGTGGSIVVRPGRGGLLNGTVEIQSSTGTQRIVATENDVNVTSGSDGGIYLAVPTGDNATNNVIGFSIDNPTDDNIEYDFRLQQFEGGQSRVVSSVPLQVTTIEYSSDERIKESIVDVDVDDVLQRFMEVEMVEYAYTEEWRQ